MIYCHGHVFMQDISKKPSSKKRYKSTFHTIHGGTHGILITDFPMHICYCNHVHGRTSITIVFKKIHAIFRTVCIIVPFQLERI